MLDDILCMNKKIAKQSIELITKNWFMVFLGLAYATINMVAYMFISIIAIGPLAIVGGFLLAILSAALMSHYLYMLNQVIKTGKINKYDVKDGFMAYIWKIYGIYFIYWIVNLLLSRIQLGIVVPLILLLVLNVLPEVIYLKYYDAVGTITYSLEFIRENWIEWYIPNSLILLIIFFYTGNVFSAGFNILINFSISKVLIFILSQFLFNYFMIYRGLLFELLSTSTRRKRAFMRSCQK